MRQPRFTPPYGPLAAFFLMVAGQVADAGTIRYTATDLGTFPGANLAIPYGINNAGEVAGVSYYAGPPDGRPHEGGSFLFTGGKMAPLPVGRARDINDARQWADGGAAGETAINDRGQTVGMNEAGHAFLRNAGAETDLGTLPDGKSSRALGLNNLGQVVGFSRGGEAAFDARPFSYADGRMVALPVHPGSSGGAAYAVNEQGQIVGGGYGTGSHPVLYERGELIDLGTLGGKGYGAAFDINELGQIVGEAPTDQEELRAFLFENGRMLDLNELISPPTGSFLSKAVGINDSGQIAAMGIVDGEIHAFRLDPVATPVPEPTATVLFGAAALVVTAGASRRRSASRHRTAK